MLELDSSCTTDDCLYEEPYFNDQDENSFEIESFDVYEKWGNDIMDDLLDEHIIPNILSGEINHSCDTSINENLDREIDFESPDIHSKVIRPVSNGVVEKYLKSSSLVRPHLFGPNKRDRVNSFKVGRASSDADKRRQSSQLPSTSIESSPPFPEQMQSSTGSGSTQPLSARQKRLASLRIRRPRSFLSESGTESKLKSFPSSPPCSDPVSLMQDFDLEISAATISPNDTTDTSQNSSSSDTSDSDYQSDRHLNKTPFATNPGDVALLTSADNEYHQTRASSNSDDSNFDLPIPDEAHHLNNLLESDVVVPLNGSGQTSRPETSKSSSDVKTFLQTLESQLSESEMKPDCPYRASLTHTQLEARLQFKLSLLDLVSQPYPISLYHRRKSSSSDLIPILLPALFLPSKSADELLQLGKSEPAGDGVLDDEEEFHRSLQLNVPKVRRHPQMSLEVGGKRPNASVKFLAKHAARSQSSVSHIDGLGAEHFIHRGLRNGSLVQSSIDHPVRDNESEVELECDHHLKSAPSRADMHWDQSVPGPENTTSSRPLNPGSDGNAKVLSTPTTAPSLDDASRVPITSSEPDPPPADCVLTTVSSSPRPRNYESTSSTAHQTTTYPRSRSTHSPCDGVGLQSSARGLTASYLPGLTASYLPETVTTTQHQFTGGTKKTSTPGMKKSLFSTITRKLSVHFRRALHLRPRSALVLIELGSSVAAYHNVVSKSRSAPSLESSYFPSDGVHRRGSNLESVVDQRGAQDSGCGSQNRTSTSGGGSDDESRSTNDLDTIGSLVGVELAVSRLHDHSSFRSEGAGVMERTEPERHESDVISGAENPRLVDDPRDTAIEEPVQRLEGDVVDSYNCNHTTGNDSSSAPPMLVSISPRSPPPSSSLRWVRSRSSSEASPAGSRTFWKSEHAAVAGPGVDTRSGEDAADVDLSSRFDDRFERERSQSLSNITDSM